MDRTVAQASPSVDDLEALTASFRRHMCAANLAPKTIRTYMEAAEGMRRFLVDRGMPVQARSIRREHVEAYIEALLERWKPATASATSSPGCEGLEYPPINDLSGFANDSRALPALRSARVDPCPGAGAAERPYAPGASVG